MDSILRSSSSHFHPLFLSSFHFHTLRPTSTSCSHSQSNSITTTNSYNSQQNPTSVSFPLPQIIKKVAAFKTQNRVSNENQESCCYLQNGGLGVALLSVTANAKVKISPFVATLASNPTFVSGLFAWFVAQSIKVFLNFFVERKWDLRLMCASGGMPSSHSALCTALTTSVALCHGVADSLFPVCLGFSLIVMYDAIGVRRHAGMQAQVLNMILADMFQGHPISERKLKELLGHTPSQVFAGALLGILVACFCCQGCIVMG
ncbi:Acid phosphatase/vanadium-dependent haloperoxidase-related protein [Trifolium repens]|nr:Acid phosphatase/vanadium-dependent haloperoxidase-related protein [Trifolium repens]